MQRLQTAKAKLACAEQQKLWQSGRLTLAAARDKQPLQSFSQVRGSRGEGCAHQFDVLCTYTSTAGMNNISAKFAKFLTNLDTHTHSGRLAQLVRAWC